MSYAPFDIIVVPFPYSDRLAEKRRPALVVSAPSLESRRGLIWVAMITSAAHPAGFGDHQIVDMKAAGLPAASMIRGGKLATIEPSRVLRTIGKLAVSDQQAAKGALKSCAAF